MADNIMKYPLYTINCVLISNPNPLSDTTTIVKIVWKTSANKVLMPKTNAKLSSFNFLATFTLEKIKSF